MTETPIYDQAFSAALEHALETGQDDMFDVLETMDSETRPGNPVLAEAAQMVEA